MIQKLLTGFFYWNLEFTLAQLLVLGRHSLMVYLQSLFHMSGMYVQYVGSWEALCLYVKCCNKFLLFVNCWIHFFLPPYYWSVLLPSLRNKKEHIKTSLCIGLPGLEVRVPFMITHCLLRLAYLSLMQSCWISRIKHIQKDVFWI